MIRALCAQVYFEDVPDFCYFGVWNMGDDALSTSDRGIIQPSMANDFPHV